MKSLDVPTLKLFPWRAWWTAVSAVALPCAYCLSVWRLLYSFHTKKTATKATTPASAQRRIVPVVMSVLPPILCSAAAD